MNPNVFDTARQDADSLPGNPFAAGLTGWAGLVSGASFARFLEKLVPYGRLRRGDAEVASRARLLVIGGTALAAIGYTNGLYFLRHNSLLAAGVLLAASFLAAAVFAFFREVQRAIDSALAVSRQSAATTARLRAILDSAADAILSVDEAGIVCSANPAACRMFGLDAPLLMGKALVELVPEVVRDTVKDPLLGYVGCEVLCQRAGGEMFPAEMTLSRVEPSQGFTAFIRDISARREAEKIKSEFTATVSHELRTPLTSIQGSLGLILGGAAGEVSGDAQELLTIAHNNCERLVRLINDILDIEKITSGRMRFHLESCDLHQISQQAARELDSFARQHGVQVVFEVGTHQPRVVADRDRLMQVAVNLLSNAIKFSPAGGKVFVGMGESSGKAAFRVKDEGPGIPEEFHSRVFDKFVQADSSDSRQKGGTGLGLSIVKAIAENMGGRVWFDTSAGKGTTFYFELPLSPEMSAGVSPRHGRTRVREGAREIALVA
ncbi:MAG: ATP-binding protein [Bdellovibrionota bacterium]